MDETVRFHFWNYISKWFIVVHPLVMYVSSAKYSVHKRADDSVRSLSVVGVGCFIGRHRFTGRGWLGDLWCSCPQRDEHYGYSCQTHDY